MLLQGYNSTKRDGLTVIYSMAVEADTFIVRTARLLLATGAEYVIVATNDYEESAYSREAGAYVISAQRVMRDIIEVRRAAEAQLKEVNARNTGLVHASGRGQILVGIEVGDATRAEDLAAMMAGFTSRQEHQEFMRSGLDALQWMNLGLKRQRRERQERREREKEAAQRARENAAPHAHGNGADGNSIEAAWSDASGSLEESDPDFSSSGESE